MNDEMDLELLYLAGLDNSLATNMLLDALESEEQ